MVTYEYGATSDCTHIVARPAARRSSVFRDVSPMSNVIVPSASSVYQTGFETGPRSGASMLRTPTRASLMKASRSSGVMLSSIVRRLRLGPARDCGVRSSLRPVASGFVVFGFFAGAFAVAAIDIERSFGLSDTGLGLLQGTGILAGTCVAAVGGIIIDRWGAGVTFARTLVVWGA